MGPKTPIEAPPYIPILTRGREVAPLVTCTYFHNISLRSHQVWLTAAHSAITRIPNFIARVHVAALYNGITNFSLIGELDAKSHLLIR